MEIIKNVKYANKNNLTILRSHVIFYCISRFLKKNQNEIHARRRQTHKHESQKSGLWINPLTFEVYHNWRKLSSISGTQKSIVIIINKS
jgi:hypothetical protein